MDEFRKELKKQLIIARRGSIVSDLLVAVLAEYDRHHPPEEASVRFERFDLNDPRVAALVEPAIDTDFASCICEVRDGVPVRCLGDDHGEPEDRNLRRDLRWVVPALNEAFAMGANHHPPRRDTPMTVDEVEAWVDGVDWLPDGYRVYLYEGFGVRTIVVKRDGVSVLSVAPGVVDTFGAALLPILDRIHRETGWGGR